jgi:HSP20 family protein
MQRSHSSHISDVQNTIKNNMKDSANHATSLTKRGMREMRDNTEEYLWSPFLNLPEQMARMMDENMRLFSSMANIWQSNPFAEKMLPQKMLPRVRVWEDDKEFHLETKLPANNPENMEVTVHDGFMTLKWEEEEFGTGGRDQRRSRNGNGNAALSSHHYSARSSLRTVMIPDNADAGKAHAVCKNGLLEVIVPKKAQAVGGGRSIPIEKSV